MAIFRSYAKVLASDDVSYKAYEAGIKKNPPGRPLEEILQFTGGVYEIQFPLGKLREDIRRVAELTSDEELLRIASHPTAPVSLEHLRDLDPQTRIILGHQLIYEGDESQRLGLGHHDPA